VKRRERQTAAELLDEQRKALECLRLLRIRRVVYYGLRYEGEVTWDFGGWHDPEMGVEFLLDDGSSVSATWGQELAHFELTLATKPMGNFLRGVGESDGPRVWVVTHHASWAALLERPVVESRLLVDTEQRFASNIDETARLTVPLAFELAFATGSVWIATAEPTEWPPQGTFRLGHNELIVVFLREIADRAGILSLTPFRHGME
jgi:hypothetical protein